jgi:hypothetical protein
MAENARSIVVVAFGVGALAGAVGAVALRSDQPGPAKTEATATVLPHREDESLMAANSRLVNALQECNRRIAQLQTRPVASAPVEAAAPSAAPAPTPAPVASAERRGPYSREDWEKFAQQGIVPYRIPCMNESAPAPAVEGAPENANAVREVYAGSNRRVLAHMAPLCASAVGNQAEKLGPSGCLKAIIDYARKDDPARLRATLVRVAEINSGKVAPSSPTTGVDPIEALLLGITAEAKALHADLAARLGPEEADRAANARGVCSERGFVTATGDAP